MKNRLILFVLGASLIFLLGKLTEAQQKKSIYLDPSQPIEKRTDDLLSRMTLDEKISQLGHLSPAIERLGIKKYNWGNECLHGVLTDSITVFPVPIAMGSSWDPELVHRVASTISSEARATYKQGKTGLTFWSPTINIARDPRWGRTQETYSEDPYLLSHMAVQFTKGLQGDDPHYLKVVSTAKHFIANNEEYRRHDGSSDVDIRSLREYYMPAFKTLVQEGNVHSIMGAYNSLDQTPCCANTFLLQTVLRDEWKFKGYVVSDCGAIADIYAQHYYVQTGAEAAAAALNAGTDLNCGDVYQAYLKEAIEKGLTTEKMVDRSLKRLLEAKILLGMFDPPSQVPYSNIHFKKEGEAASADAVSLEENRKLARQAARESIVLLKNENNTLPLDKSKIKSVAVIGPNADVARLGIYSGVPAYAVSPLQGIKNALGANVKVEYSEGYKLDYDPVTSDELVPPDANKGVHGLKGEYYSNKYFKGKPVLVRIDKNIDFDWGLKAPADVLPVDSFSVRWTGKFIPKGKCKIGTVSDDGVRMWINGKLVIDDWKSHAAQANRADMVLEPGKEYDIKLEYFEDWEGATVKLGSLPLSFDKFDKAIQSAKNSDAVIFVVDGGNEGEGFDKLDMSPPGVPYELLKAIKEVNKNVVAVLINGTVFTIDPLKQNVTAIVEAWFTGEEEGNAIADVLFGDYNPGGKLPLTYYKADDQLPPFYDYDVKKGRTYMYFNGVPEYAFGYGLSYTTFNYSNLKISKNTVTKLDTVKVSFDVKNTGQRAGDEITQLYVHDVKSPVKLPNKQLKGFKRVHLNPGETKTVTLTVPVGGLNYYDVLKKDFVVDPGKFEVMVGAASDNILLEGDIEVVQ